MKRFINSPWTKYGFAVVGGGTLAGTGLAFTHRQPGQPGQGFASGSLTRLFKKHIVTAEGFTNSVLETKSKYSPSLWDRNWDKREPESVVKPLPANPTAEDEEKRREKVLCHTPRAKRIIVLVRHGQYNESGKDDSERILTSLGREQADLTGKRLAEMSEYLKTKIPLDDNNNKQDIDVRFVTSTMARAMETSGIILKHFPGQSATSCDLIREGAPCEPVPPISSTLWCPTPQAFYEDGARIEAAFRKHIHRADYRQVNDSIDIIVCHANVIRYFVCRALQLPPEAWLRFSLYNGSFTVMSVQPSGCVSVSLMGEAGHFPVDKMTFH